MVRGLADALWYCPQLRTLRLYGAGASVREPLRGAWQAARGAPAKLQAGFTVDGQDGWQLSAL